MHALKDYWVERGTGGMELAAGTVLELAVPLVDVAAKVGDALAFFVVVHGVGGAEVERHPSDRPIEAEVPDERFEARNWTT